MGLRLLIGRLRMCNQYRAVRQWLAGQKKGIRVIFLLLTAVVTLYIVILLWMLPEMMETIPMDTKYWKVKILTALLMLAPVYVLLLWGAYRCFLVKITTGTWEGFTENRLLGGGKTEERKQCLRLIRLWFLMGAGVTFLWLMVYYYTYFPGSFDLDNLDQWWQIQNSQYDTWHPVFHTLIIAFFTKIVNHYGFAVFMQLFLYSLLCGYLIVTMAKWRFPVWSLLLTEFFLAANPQTHRLLLFMWKDSALTLFMLLFTVYLLNTWLSNGAWLKKRRNLTVWILVLISISMVRHNSILFTIPFLVLTILFFREIRRESVISLVLMLIGMLVIKYPVYDLVEASRPKQTYAEMVGVPMTILCNIHETAPESLPPEAAELLDSIGPKERWKTYEMGNYNSLKFVSNANIVVRETQPADFLKLMVRTIGNAPGLSLQAFYQVTRMAWDIRGATPWHEDLEFQLHENEWGFSYVENRRPLQIVLNDFDNWVMNSPFDILFSYNGLHLLAMILCTLFVFIKKGKRWKAMCIPLSLLTYSFGTMMLLCGPTYRFFHFNSVIVVPICLLLFANETGAVEK